MRSWTISEKAVFSFKYYRNFKVYYWDQRDDSVGKRTQYASMKTWVWTPSSHVKVCTAMGACYTSVAENREMKVLWDSWAAGLAYRETFWSQDNKSREWWRTQIIPLPFMWTPSPHHTHTHNLILRSVFKAKPNKLIRFVEE